MTRWARQHAARSPGVLEATPWEKMADGAPEGSVKAGPDHGCRPLCLQRNPGGKKKTRKKKDYVNEDVNGFLEHMRQSARGGLVLAAHNPEVRAEVAVALKKDQRREGRRLKRQEKKKCAMVCFHCRKPGHGIADCPAALENQDMGTGICYRCGSTEHEISKCKAKIDPAVGEFPFAKCFICGEMGHLSRSCPDNPKGLYAEGGCCRLCGSVEHFKKDCPENQYSDQVTVGRWSRGMSADHEDIVESPKPQKTKVKVPKVVNF